MGTINYGRNKYITLGINTNDICYEDEFDQDIINDDYDECKRILDKYEFEHFKVQLKSGYYEGFYLELEYYDYVFVDNSYEKNEMIKEATKIKKLLIELAEYGLVACHPGWCTSYLNTQDTFKEIQKAIKTMKEDIKKIPTYKIFKRNGGKLI